MDIATIQRPLDILVVGAGIGGLTAALGLRQQGHNVTILEKSTLAQETGAAVHLAPNCHGILRRLGIFPEKFGANPVHGIIEYDKTGAVKMDIDLDKANDMWQHPWLLSHRIGLHNALKKHATSPNGLGRPANLQTASQVVSVDALNSTVTLSDGHTMKGDLVLGADGVGSVARKHAVGQDMKPFGSGKSAFRFMIPRDAISSNKATADLVEREGRLIMWYGSDRRIAMYPCDNNSLMNFVAIHPSNLSSSESEGWSGAGSKTKLLEIFKEFGPKVQSLLTLADEKTIKLWALLDMERIPKWCEGRLALLGDAAHPFLPYQGQGAGIAIEDAGSLAAVFSTPVDVDEIPERLQLYEKIRDKRAHRIQYVTRLTGQDQDENNAEKVNPRDFTNYNFGHDEWHNSIDALRKHLQIHNGTFYRRMPLAWGPLPSPRQDLEGNSIGAGDASFTTYTIRFQTSATLLKTLFPTESFKFISPATVAEASFQCTELDKLAWLGGGGYTFFAFWIHGVQYEREDGAKIDGNYVPLILENLADPILTGREELGLPKLYSEIVVSKQGNSRTITCSWRGTDFITMKLSGLEENHSEEVPEVVSLKNCEQSKGNTMLSYRYMPAVGKPGVADAAYAVAIDPAASRVSTRVLRTSEATSSSIQCTPADGLMLPTLQNIATRLAEVPFYKILTTRIEEGQGVDDLSQAQRIE